MPVHSVMAECRVWLHVVLSILRLVLRSCTMLRLVAFMHNAKAGSVYTLLYVSLCYRKEEGRGATLKEPARFCAG